MRPRGMIGAIAVLACAFSTTQAQVTYNFSGAHTGHNAYEGTIPSSPLPPTSRTVPATELSSSDYIEIASSNDDTDSISNSSSSNRAAQRYVFTLAQSGASLFDMDVLWEGQTSSGGTVRFYIWNKNTLSYTLIGSTSNSSSDVNLTAVYTSPSQYVDANNKVTLLVLNTADDESVRTDYVRVIVRQCATSDDCHDNNACTTNTCNAGLCVFTNNANACTDDGNTCTNDVCAGGACTHPNKSNGSACSDGNACTQTDSCQSGTCTGSNPVICTALDTCHNVGTCTPATGICSNPAKPNGTACSDGLFCNGAEVCTGGTCQAPSAPNCNDGVPCTTDSCNEATDSCDHAPNHAACSDGLNCNGSETCHITLGCQPGKPVNCDDGVACTVDSCNEIGGRAFSSTAVSHVSGDTHVKSLGVPAGGDFTAMMWARIDVDRGAPSTFFFIGGSNADPRYFKSFYAGTGGDPAGRTTWIQALTPGTPIDPGNSDVLELGAWHHITMVANASSGGPIKLYLDGVLRQSGNAPAGTYAGDFIELLNVPINGGNDRMIGSFAAWKRFNVQMTQSQIQVEMPYARAVNRTSLVQEVTFQNNTDTLDQSGNGNHFTVTGTPLTNAAIGPNIQDEPLQTCQHTPSNTACNDGLHCNGVETCHATLGCQAGTPPNCNDGVACTADSCNEATDTCDHVPNNAACGDGLFCNGAETCHVTQGCQAGTPPNCNDGIECTGDSCNESADNCDHLPNNGACDDGSFCNGSETCHVTLGCQPGTPPNCADNVACTDDRCENNACVHVPNNGRCTDDGLFCTGAEICHPIDGCLSAGDPCPVGQHCNEGTDSCGECAINAHCDDGVGCTDDTCVLGGCVYTANNAHCPGDNVFCNGSEYCDLVLDCRSTGNPCSAEFVCRESDDSCVACLVNTDCDEETPFCIVAPGVCVECLTDADCDEGDPCIVGHACVEGACHAGTSVGCSGFNTDCTTASCDPAGTEGNCDIDTPVANGAECSDGNECTNGDSCMGGVCQAGTPKTCVPPDQCHAAGICNPETGSCSYASLENGTGCNDANACTLEDACSNGVCLPGTLVACDPADQCHAAGMCNPETGICSYAPLENGTPCSDGNACTLEDDCADGACTAGTPMQCAPPDQCHAAGTCNPETGTCSYALLENGTPCNDGNACTLNDVCTNGACAAGTSVECIPEGQCQVGECNPESGVCSFTPAESGTSCDDGNNCTVDDACHEGTCQGYEVYTISKWGAMSDCLTGPDTGNSEACDCSNLAPDEHIDLRDVAEFMLRFGGE